MADAFIQLPADGVGKKLDADTLTVSAETVYRERDRIAGGAAAELADVRNAAPTSTDYGLVVRHVGTVSSDKVVPTNPVVEYKTGSVGSKGGTLNLDTSDIPSKYLVRVEVWTSVAFKAALYKLSNGAASPATPIALGGGAAFVPWFWEPPHRTYAQAPTTTAGVDGFRLTVTNLASSAADAYVVFYYQDN